MSPHLVHGFPSANNSTAKSIPDVVQNAYFNNKQYLRVKSSSNSLRKSKKRRKLLSEKLISYYQTRTHLSRLYSELGNEKKSQKLYKCSSFFNVTTCGEHIYKKQANFRCNNRLCPVCANRRANRLFYEYEPIVNSFLADRPELTVLHLVLTQSQRPDETFKDSRQRLISAQKRLIDRKFWKDSFAGSLNAYEFTISEKTYAQGAIHYHAHLLVFCKISDKKRNKKWLAQFRQAWSSVSNGENKNFKIRPVVNLQDGLREVLKYVVKPQDISKLSTNHLAQIEELHKCRMISTTDEFHQFVKAYRKDNVIPKDGAQDEYKSLVAGDVCPTCQKPLYERQMPVKELIVFAQQIEQVKGINSVRC